MLSSTTKESFLQLVRLGIGHRVQDLSDVFDWNELEALAVRQGLLAVLLEGIGRLPENKRPPKTTLLQWIGGTLQGYEHRYDSYTRVIAEMAAWHNSHGYKMMILKGYACSLDWPTPKHRPCGDIDIWQFGQRKNVDALLVKEKGFKVDNSHHHHTCFVWNGYSVENHYDFLNVHHHKSNVGLETIFKELGKDDSHFVYINGVKVYLPSPNLHALFLLKHSMTDFAAFYLTIRQVLDWAFYVKKHHDEIDWKWLDEVMEQYHMKEFFNYINAISVYDLGFDVCNFNDIQYKSSIKDKILADILEPKYKREEPRSLVKRLVFKYKRWNGNVWKHKICYNESLKESFFSGVWNHLLKPNSI